MVVKAAVQNAENEEIKKKSLSTAKYTAESYQKLLVHIMDVSNQLYTEIKPSCSIISLGSRCHLLLIVQDALVVSR